MYIIIFLFIFELFFGFNGKWLVLGGISIRHWLFAIVLFIVYGKAVCFFLKRLKQKRSPGCKFGKVFREELATFSSFDWCLLFFASLHGIWIILIPFTQLDENPEALKEAISSGLSASMLALYYPSVYLLRNNQIKWNKYRHLVMGCVIALGIWHILLYTMERIQWQQDHSQYFMKKIFIWWETVVQNRCELPIILMPKYSVRIIYTCNILLILSFYFVVGQKKKRYFVWLLLGVLALFTTGTRSLLVGAIVGAGVYLIANIIVHKWSWREIRKSLLNFCVIIVIAITFDGLAFRGMNLTRLSASFAVSESVMESGEVEILTWDSTEYSTESEIRGTINSNSTRVLQVEYYINKFLEKPWFGHGFAMQSEMDRDLQGVVYLCKVGLVGIAACIALFICFLRRVINMEKSETGSGFPALYLVVAVLVDIQFQMMFGSLTMAMAVFLLLDLEYKELEIKRGTNEISDLCAND